jgi:alcohol dehydrogenase
MTGRELPVPPILASSAVRVAFGHGALDSVGQLARDEGATRVFLVSDRGVKAVGHVDRAVDALRAADLPVTVFVDTCENPTSHEVAAGLSAAHRAEPDFFIGLGGGSAMDCAKGINLLYTNGGDIVDYWGENKAVMPLCASILIPTTAGTGSEAQSFALISDSTTHQKMACGDRRDPRVGGLRPRIAILDPDLTRTQPLSVAAAAGIDAIAHAVETAGSVRRTAESRELSHAAWTLLAHAFPASLQSNAQDQVRADALLGAHIAGAAIEASMLGAAHACSNPLTAHCGISHGVAVGLLLPHVVRFNATPSENPYAALDDDAAHLANTISSLLDAARLPRRLRDLAVPAAQLPAFADEAARQWTARFNPRPVDAEALLGVYRAAW